MTIEQEILAGVVAITRDDRRLDDADSRIDATIWAYFGVFFTAADTIFSGWMSAMARRRLAPSNPICTAAMGFSGHGQACAQA